MIRILHPGTVDVQRQCRVFTCCKCLGDFEADGSVVTSMWTVQCPTPECFNHLRWDDGQRTDGHSSSSPPPRTEISLSYAYTDDGYRYDAFISNLTVDQLIKLRNAIAQYDELAPLANELLSRETYYLKLQKEDEARALEREKP